ncbi:MAG TPA: PaaI family thioesterase [Dongiaceae bacterium]|nr:PaaI family thioesterase [Dongiaceae bacterium]
MHVTGQIDFTITEQTPDAVRAEMPIQPGILNPFGTVHAGATLWFADVTATVLALGSVNASENMQGFPLAINLNASLVGNSKSGTFIANAVFVKKGRSLSIVRTTVTTADGKLIAEITTSHVPSR